MSATTAKIRADLDAAIDAALPIAGYRVRGALHRLRNELSDVDRRNMAADERSASWPFWVRDAVLTPDTAPKLIESTRKHEGLCGQGQADPCFEDDFTEACTCWCHQTPTITAPNPPLSEDPVARRLELFDEHGQPLCRCVAGKCPGHGTTASGSNQSQAGGA